MSEGREIRVARKCHELRKQGLKWKQIADALPTFGKDYLMQKGTPYEVEALRVLYSSHRNWILSHYEQEERTEPNENLSSDESKKDLRVFVQKLFNDQLPKITEDLIHLVRDIVQEEFSQRLDSTYYAGEPKGEGDRVPPEPEDIKGLSGGKGKGRRKQNRKYVKKTLTIDENLWNLFEKEMKSSRVFSAGRMIDIILWKYFQEPALSYMTGSKESDKEE